MNWGAWEDERIVEGGWRRRGRLRGVEVVVAREVRGLDGSDEGGGSLVIGTAELSTNSVDGGKRGPQFR